MKNILEYVPILSTYIVSMISYKHNFLTFETIILAQKLPKGNQARATIYVVNHWNQQKE